MTLLLESAIRITTDSVGREQRMRLLHKTMKLVVQHLQKCELQVLVVETRELVERKGQLLLVSFWCDISENKYMSVV